MSFWQHTGVGWLQLGKEFSYCDPLMLNQAYSVGIVWGIAAFQYAAVSTQDGELPDFTPLEAHSAHTQMLRGRPLIVRSSRIKPQNHLTVAVCPFHILGWGDAISQWCLFK